MLCLTLAKWGGGESGAVTLPRWVCTSGRLLSHLVLSCGSELSCLSPKITAYMLKRVDMFSDGFYSIEGTNGPEFCC